MPKIISEVDIAADLESVYAIAKEVERFPEFMPDLESVEILQRDGSRTLSRWVGKIKEFGRTIKWTEEDHWDDAAHTCVFSQTEGDFTSYSGTWAFTRTNKGCHARIEVDYEYDVPLVGALIKGLLRKKVQQNCDNMLAALKQKAER